MLSTIFNWWSVMFIKTLTSLASLDIDSNWLKPVKICVRLSAAKPQTRPALGSEHVYLTVSVRA